LLSEAELELGSELALAAELELPAAAGAADALCEGGLWEAGGAAA